MVYYFQTRDGHMVYVGKDKFENEDLIRYGWPEDVWFHADDYSSAHVYLRLHEGETFETIPETALEDCCQLTKMGSIQGSKMEKINVVLTPWSNLKKEQSMEVGSVAYHKENLRIVVKNIVKTPDILRVLVKTKREEYPNFQELKDLHVSELQKIKLTQFKSQAKEQQQLSQKQKVEDDLKSYKTFFMVDNYKTNKEQDEEDDFM